MTSPNKLRTNLNRKVVKGNLNSIWFIEIFERFTSRTNVCYSRKKRKSEHMRIWNTRASIVCPRYVIITFGVRRFVTDCDLCDNKCPDFTANGSINSTLLPLPGFPLLTGHKGGWARGKYEEWWIHHGVLLSTVCVYISQVRMYRRSFIIYLCWM